MPFEAIKDFLGIMDDAQDFIDATNSNVRRAHSIVGRFDAAAGVLRKQVDRLRGTTDLKAADRLLKAMDFGKPYLFGRTLLQQLRGIEEDFDTLEGKLRKMPPAIQAKALRPLRDGRRKMQEAMKRNIGALRQISVVQDQHRQYVRSVAKTLAVSGVISVALAGLGAFLAVTAMREVGQLAIGSAIRGLLGGVRQSLGDTSSTLTTAGQEAVETVGAG